MPDGTGGDLYVLFPQRRNDITGGKTAVGDFRRVQPDAHGVLARAPDENIADAG